MVSTAESEGNATDIVPEMAGSGDSIMAQTRQLIGLVRRAPAKRPLTLFAGAIVTVIVLNAITQIRLNTWQGSIYDSIAQRDLAVFYRELGVFGAIVSILLVLGVAQTWLHELLKVKLREAVTFDLLDEWLRPKRAYRMPLVGQIGVHPDQRIQDDTRRLTELSVDLGVGLVHSTLLLVSFVGVLWVLSGQVIFVVDGATFSIPGYMVWSALAYALIGSYLTWLVGRPLIEANTELRAREAEFRYLLVRVNESAEAIAVHRGEGDERRNLGLVATNVLIMMRQIANSLARLNWVTGGYGWIALIAPIVLAAPGYFSGTLTLGGLMMVVGAFYQVQNSLRWYVDRFPALAEWRATLTRVISYRDALVKLETLGYDREQIVYTDHHGGKLSLDDFAADAPNGRISLPDKQVDISAGERVLIAGTPRSGKSTFFRAMAGLWVWGKGTLRLPRRGTVMFLPHRPYIPLGTLREALAYPSPPARFSDEAMSAALSRIRLERLIPSLDDATRWDQELPLDELQRIAFARILLQKPDWVIQDEAMSELDDDNRKLAESIFKHDLAGITLISIGKRSDDGNFYDRVLSLEAHPPGLSLPLRLRAEPVAA